MKEGKNRFPHPPEGTNPKEEKTTFTIKSGQQERTTKPNEPTTEETETTRPKNKRRPRIRKNKEITIATINVRGIKGKIRSLETALNTEKISIALITETQLKKGEQISIKGYRWIHRPRPNNKGGGVGILVAEKLAQSTTEDTPNEDHEQLETKWIKLECRPRNIAIGVFYGPQENEKMEKAKDIFTALGHQIAQKAQNNEVIIAGDFNAKLQINSNSCKQHISRNGKLLREIMDNNDLTPANLKSNHGIWTRVNRKNAEEKSVIDYILTTEQIARNTQSVIVDEEGNLRIKGKNETDHNTIIMSIRINDPRKPTFREKWNLKNKEGWTKFNKEITEAYNNNNIKINKYQEAEKEIKKILKKTIGTKKIRSDKTRRVTNQDIKEARKIMKNHKKEFQKACKTGTTEDKITTKKTYMASQVKLRSEINKAESALIEERLKKLHEKAIINPNTIWEARKKAKGCRELDYNTYSEEGTLIEDPEKTKDHIANYFEQLYQAREGTAPYAEWTNKIKTQVRKNLEKDPDTITEKEDQITEKEMKAAIKKLKRNKSLGPDKIPNEIFIEANKETRKVLKEIIQKVHKEEEIPRSWEEGEIIRLYKGKGLKGKCSNERGITLASNVGKLYERIINERVKKQVKITKAQAGGKPGCSTVDHLIVLKQTISEIRAKGQTAYIIFLDVQKAYDKAWLDAIIYALHQNGVKGKNLRMIKKLNSNLTAKIQTRHGLTRKIQIKDSIRQGGVLSVIEYATLIDEIAKELRQKNLGYVTQANITLDSLLWMDDVCLIHHDLDKLQEILDVTNHVANKYHIQFGAAKCKVIKRGKGKKSSLKLNGEELEEVPAYKYLGETLNNKGNLSDHIAEIERKIKGATANIISETGNKEFKGIKMQAIWQMVDAIIIPIMTYACEGWTIGKEENKKLQTIFNEVIKTLLYLPKGIPTMILLNETGYMPVEYTIMRKKIMQAKRIDMMKEEALIKDATQPETSTWRKHIEDIAKDLNVYEQMTILPKEALKTQITKEVESKIQVELENEAEQKTKVGHWRQWKKDIKIGIRPKYMDKLSRKQCNAIIRTRASMMMVKANYKTEYGPNLSCRLCQQQKETQQHILQDCPEIERPHGKIKYSKIFEEDPYTLRNLSESIIAIEERLRNLSLHSMSSSSRSEPPGWPGHMQNYYY